MEPFTVVKGPAAALRVSNVDTDRIIRIERLTSLKKEDLGPYALESMRYDAEGKERPDFVLNWEPFRQAPILLALENFGCGSSREGAVHALQMRGVRVVIAPSFGDIFRGNCFQNGVLAIELAEDVVISLMSVAETGAMFDVDLTDCVIRLPEGQRQSFAIPQIRRESLLSGMTDLEMTLSRDRVIRDWQQQDRAKRPWIWNAVRA